MRTREEVGSCVEKELGLSDCTIFIDVVIDSFEYFHFYLLIHILWMCVHVRAEARS